MEVREAAKTMTFFSSIDKGAPLLDNIVTIYAAYTCFNEISSPLDNRFPHSSRFVRFFAEATKISTN